jgi:CubicO group peptidase (beta-lactamase class C family)
MSSDSTADAHFNRRSFLRAGVALPAATAIACRTAHAAFARTIDARQEERIRGLVDEYMKAFDVPGLSLAYGRGGELLFARGFGVADRESRDSVRVENLFRIASVSKSLTSAAIFSLVEKGALTTADRPFASDGLLHAYAKAAQRPDWVGAITIQHLLTHTSGGWTNDETDPMMGNRGLDAQQLIAHTLATRPPQYPPGEHYEYSNFGYCILGRVIEAATGVAYDRYVQGRILDRVGITDMRIATKEPAAREVHYYKTTADDPYALPITRMDSHGGWIATPTDLVRYATALFGATDRGGARPLLSPDSLAAICSGTTANPKYGCGWRIDRDRTFHTGHLPGTEALLVHAKDGVTWAVVLNTRDKRRPEMTTALDRLMTQIRATVPQWGPVAPVRGRRK